MKHLTSLSFFSSLLKRERRQNLLERRKHKHVCGLEVLERRSLMAASIFQSSSSALESTPAVTRLITPQTPANSTASEHPSVGLVGDARGSFCTGTLITSEYVLTAAHCAEGVGNSSGRFIVGGRTFGTSQVIVHPNYNGNRIGSDSANDIALYKLSQLVTNVTPSPIYRSAPAVGETLTLVGFGGGRNAAGASDGSFGTKRVGTTPIDRVSQSLVGWRYDNLSESNTAPGDSGGPSYLKVGNVFYVAGVTSGGSSANAGIGDNSFNTRVDAFQSWIDSIVRTSGNPLPPVLPTVSITSSDTNAAETRSGQAVNGGLVVITRTGSIGTPLTVRLAISGSATNGNDYVGIPNTVTIPANSSSVRINLLPQDDFLSEATETAIFTIGTDATYSVATSSRSTTISIADNDASSSNDRFANRQLLSGRSVTATGSSVSATRETGEPNVAGASGGKSIWYSWTAAASGTVTLTTAGSTFDTTLGVYTGTALTALRLVASNDDENYNRGTLTSRTSFSAVAGTTYQILVDGYSGASGNVNLSLNQGSSQRIVGTTTSANASVSRISATLSIQTSSTPGEAFKNRWASNAVRDLVYAAIRRW